MDRSTRLAWWVISWNVITILLGAVVRATHSGAGCGRSWPTCRGELLPELAGATTIEYIHRATSGVALLLVAILVIHVFRSRPPGNSARKAAAWAGGAIVGEALIGAAIVIYEWVGSDDSLARVVSVPLHLVNTLLLLGSLTLTAWFLNGGGSLQRRTGLRWLVVGGGALMLITTTGAVTALADTLFPVAGLADQDATHFLTRLRVAHPLLAVTAVVAALLAARARGFQPLNLVRWVLTLSVFQLGLGGLNVLLATPLWLQILHLAVADSIWIAYVWLTAQILASDSASAVGSSTGARQVNPLHR
ncbi:MAG: COX15/CtaA family protein [Acidimicrobiia bacterium]|nr:COX15/CtaA family protein [Acidimicrobiia bacterium]